MSTVAILDRRALLERIGLLLGAAALPAGAVFEAQAAASRRFLAREPFALLRAVADTLIPRTDTPGAVQAGVPAVFDALLANWAAPATRTGLQAALQGIDAAAVAATGQRYASLDAATRLRVLRDHDAAALQLAPDGGGPTGLAAYFAGPPVVDGGYKRLKELIVNLYYASQVGLTRELTYEHAPGKWQPSVPVTADTRPAGGGGAF